MMFQNGLIIGDIQEQNQISTPRFSFDDLDHGKGYVFIEMKSFFDKKAHLLTMDFFGGKVDDNHI